MRARIVHGAVVAALTATGVAWVGTDKTVTVEIDDERRIVHTHASTVAEVLDRAGITVDAHDVLAPSGSVAVKDGSTIVIRRGRLVNVRVNDVERGIWVNASNVSQVLHEIGIDADERTYVSASRSSRVPSTGNFSLHVRMPSEVTVIREDVPRTVVTTAATVGELLAAERITLTAHEDVNVALDSYPADGTTIVVQDRRGVRIARPRPIPFPTKSLIDPALAKGKSRTVSPGIPGVLVEYFRQASIAGVVTTTVPDGSRVARPPRARVIVVGGKLVPAAAKPAVKAKPKVVPPPAKPVAKPVAKPAVKKPVAKPVVKKPVVKKPAARPVAAKPPTKPVVRKPAPKAPANKPAADNLNWRALAMCESGNNPRAVSRTGRYRGLYQFAMATWRSVGGVGDPIDASRDEQTYRAQILYRRVGAGAWGSCASRLYRR